MDMLALRVISRTVTKGEAGVWLTAVMVTAPALNSTPRDKPFLQEPFDVRPDDNKRDGCLVTTGHSVGSEVHAVCPQKCSLKNYFGFWQLY